MTKTKTRDPEVGSALTPSGRYRLGKELGRGGIGSVVQAVDARGRLVAMKRLLNQEPSEVERQRFRREAEITRLLEHRHIVEVYDEGRDVEGRPYFSMQFVKGAETLRTIIDRLDLGDPTYARRYPLARRVQIMQAVCRAVHHAHRVGIVHRDIKPEHVLVGPPPVNEVLLLDWGLAHIGEPLCGPDYALRLPADVDPRVTDPDEVLGTPLYMAPEQYCGEATVQTDLFSLSAVLFEFLTLRHYLRDPAWTLPALVQQILRESPLEADRVSHPANPRVPGGLARICARGLDKDPNRRPRSAAELADDLHAWLAGVRTVSRRRERWWGALREWAWPQAG